MVEMDEKDRRPADDSRILVADSRILVPFFGNTIFYSRCARLRVGAWLEGERTKRALTNY